MADQDEQKNTKILKKCRDQLDKIGAWPLFAKIAVWVVLALFVFFLVTKGLSGDGVLGFMAYLGSGAEPIKITATALTMIGGIGAVGYLVIKYQERTAAQRAEQRENEQQQLARQAEEREQRAEQRAIARQQADELLDAIHLLGDDKASTRVAGVQSLVQIGQSRSEMRQRIIDILCGYLRTDRDKDGSVESTILTTLHEHLLPKGAYAPLFWADIDLDLRNSTITEPINLSGIVCRRIDMSEAHINSITRPNFSYAEFTLNAHFQNITCSKGMDFSHAKFGMGMEEKPEEREAVFSGAHLQEYKFLGAEFMNANFVDSQISRCDFTRSYFHHASFWRSKVDKTIFLCALLEDAGFNYCRFSGVDFRRAVFPDDTSFVLSSFENSADFGMCNVASSLIFDDASFGEEGQVTRVVFDEARLFGSIRAVNARNQGSWSFNRTHFLKSTENIQTQFPDGMHGSTGNNITFEKAIFDLDEKDASSAVKEWEQTTAILS